LLQASAVLGRGEFVPTAGFLWIEDADVRDLLRTRRRTADLFIDPSPLGGLLIAPGVELDRLVLRCRGLGVEVLSDGEVYHARSRTPAPKRKLTRMLLTSRPDLLPIDLKRQGRAEVHVPLFYPTTAEDITTMLQMMAKKNKVKLGEDAIPTVDPARRLSGADLESIMLSARRLSMTAGRDAVERADLDQALTEFIPSVQGLEKELQELAAVLECTQMRFLPAEWQEKVKAPEGRSRLQERMVAIRQLIEEM
jgi:hypothetical protein